MDNYIPKEMRDSKDQPFDWVDDILKVIKICMAFVGLISIALIGGLYASGLFTWLAHKVPDNKVLQFLFG